MRTAGENQVKGTLLADQAEAPVFGKVLHAELIFVGHLHSNCLLPDHEAKDVFYSHTFGLGLILETTLGQLLFYIEDSSVLTVIN